MCHWTHQGDSDADDFESFGAYQRTLELKCDQGEPGVIQWTPDKNTPDTVYYQCFTHRYLGWKIHVIDSCDTQAAGSEVKPVVVLPDPLEYHEYIPEDLAESPSQIVETRIKFNDILRDAKSEFKVKENATKEEDGMDSKGPQLFLDATKTSSNYRQQFETHLPSKPTFPYRYQMPYQNDEITPQQNRSNVIATTIITPSAVQWLTKDRNVTKTAKPMNVEVMRIPSSKTTTIRKPFYSETPLVLQNKPYIPDITMKTILRPINRVTLKKPYYRPLVKIQSRPVRMPSPHFHPKPQKLQEIVILKTQSKPALIQKPLQLKEPAIPKPPEVHNVELSPPQASTEKEPGLKTSKPYAPLVSVKPDKEMYHSLKMRPAVNTGFKPESIVIEGGFKPIISKELEDRKDEEGPELEYESEIGVIDVGNESSEQKVVETFEPVFIPSPLDKQTVRKPIKMRKRANTKKNALLLIIKQGRSLESSENEDEIAEAAERVDAYYLPPPDKKNKLNDTPKKPSDIDIPPGTVVTYDGKKVSGASLTAKIVDRGSVLNNRASKATELIKAGPQFAPFKGPLPPLDPKYMNTDVPQVQSRGVISRDLDAPPSLVRATRLSLIKQLEEITEESGRSRRKREAHHTPEHTAEQLRNKNETETAHSSSNKLIICTSLVLVVCLVKLL